MDRRKFNSAFTSALGGLAMTPLLPSTAAHALGLGDVSGTDASQGVKVALEKGALAAVGLLGKTDGFLGNPKVRIPLPAYLEDAAKLMRTLGQGKRIDELVTAMNRAAEQAVSMASSLLVDAVKSMGVTDAKNILTGGDTAATDFFSAKTRAPLAAQFLPVVTQAIEKTTLAAQYNSIAGKAASMGLLKQQDANIQQYVTGKTLDGLFLMIAEEEKKIRQNPVGSGSALLQKVFGAIK